MDKELAKTSWDLWKFTEKDSCNVYKSKWNWCRVFPSLVTYGWVGYPYNPVWAVRGCKWFHHLLDRNFISPFICTAMKSVILLFSNIYQRFARNREGFASPNHHDFHGNFNNISAICKPGFHPPRGYFHHFIYVDVGSLKTWDDCKV